MAQKFHTPSLGDDVLDLTECDTDIELVAQQNADKAAKDENAPALSTRSQNKRRGPADNLAGATGDPHVFQAPVTMAARKQVSTQEGQPLSAYGCFFKETAATIKAQNPQCTYPELSRIASSIWNSMENVDKVQYYLKAEAAQTKQNIPTAAATSSAVTAGIDQIAINDPTASKLEQAAKKSPHNQAQKLKMAEEIFGGNDDKNVRAQFQPINIASIIGQDGGAQAEQPDDGKAAKMNAEQMLSEAGAVRKCTRDGCNKRAIINPDWEDEYCSNECVVAHCRAVFTAWVKTNKEKNKT